MERTSDRATAAGAAQPRQPWPMLHARTQQLVFGTAVGLTESLTDALIAVVEAPFAVSFRADASPAATAAVVERLLPARAAAVALAARVCDALRMHAEQLPLGGARGAAAAAQPTEMVEAGQGLLRLALYRMRGAPQPELEACLPGLMALFGDFSGLLATPAGLAWAGVEAVANSASVLASCVRSASAQLGELAIGGVPEVLSNQAPRFGLALFVVQLGCGEHGLVSLLPELQACMRLADAGGDGGGRAAGRGGAGISEDAAGGTGAGESAAEGGHVPGAADVCMVAQAMAACGAAALPVLAPLLEQAAEWSRREAAQAAEAAARRSAARRVRGGSGGSSGPGGFGYRDLFPVMAMRSVAAADAVLSAARHLPADALLAAAPQRALAALGQLLHQLQQEQRPEQQQGDAAFSHEIASLSITLSVLLLSTDERLVERCVPGWLWVKEGPGTAGPVDLEKIDLAALAAVCGPSYAPQQGPILTITVSGAAAARFRSWRWEDHRQHRAEVVALARVRAQELRLLEGRAWQVAAGAGGGRALWPPGLLRMCANPGCGSYGSGGEGEPKLLRCSLCVGVRYCDAACQKQHWPQHKGECRPWAAAAAAAAAGEEGDG
ncbi:hypothetical protein TSOC_010149 [Tetrabaena socialis]|uniref:MYND-type domain-containing protein n=1 Tax=Tetrabaena socialis TaxID=47790 RepID=A0A2J7ZU10_9CHLO|nr:hypothetical protein TSOC_010149 [Tetrabaena socialis]|eukprot:PNH03766.1 hypothetical protein TSOC_010149 [Tetrabaena socialis]